MEHQEWISINAPPKSGAFLKLESHSQGELVMFEMGFDSCYFELSALPLNQPAIPPMTDDIEGLYCIEGIHQNSCSWMKK